jgi:hypothetical protein
VLKSSPKSCLFFFQRFTDFKNYVHLVLILSLSSIVSLCCSLTGFIYWIVFHCSLLIGDNPNGYLVKYTLFTLGFWVIFLKVLWAQIGSASFGDYTKPRGLNYRAVGGQVTCFEIYWFRVADPTIISLSKKSPGVKSRFYLRLPTFWLTLLVFRCFVTVLTEASSTWWIDRSLGPSCEKTDLF